VVPVEIDNYRRYVMATTGPILIVTESDDHHVRIIAEMLVQQAIPVHRLNVDVFLEDPDTAPFMWNIADGTRDMHPAQFPHNVSTVWYRRRNPFHDASDTIGSFVWQEQEGLLESILNMYDSCRWINRRDSIARARPKLSQLVQAQRHGLRIPRTTITNDLDELTVFAETCGGNIVAKPIQTQVLHSGTDHLVLGTRTLHKDEFGSAISHVPCYAQEKLTIRSEIRVVAFGADMYAFRQTHLTNADDIKQLSLEQIHHEYFTLDGHLTRQLQALMRYYELEFAAIDLVEVDDGPPLFLEINPNGQWLWLQYATGKDLATPFVHFLCR
jgi:hypothetical protein